jgi:hypothetical protein
MNLNDTKRLGFFLENEDFSKVLNGIIDGRNFDIVTSDEVRMELELDEGETKITLRMWLNGIGQIITNSKGRVGVYSHQEGWANYIYTAI